MFILCAGTVHQSPEGVITPFSIHFNMAHPSYLSLKYVPTIYQYSGCEKRWAYIYWFMGLPE